MVGGGHEHYDCYKKTFILCQIETNFAQNWRKFCLNTAKYISILQVSGGHEHYEYYKDIFILCQIETKFCSKLAQILKLNMNIESIFTVGGWSGPLQMLITNAFHLRDLHLVPN